MEIYLLIEISTKQHTIDLYCLRVVDFKVDDGPRGCSLESLDAELSRTPRPPPDHPLTNPSQPPHYHYFLNPPHADLPCNGS